MVENTLAVPQRVRHRGTWVALSSVLLISAWAGPGLRVWDQAPCPALCWAWSLFGILLSPSPTPPSFTCMHSLFLKKKEVKPRIPVSLRYVPERTEKMFAQKLRRECCSNVVHNTNKGKTAQMSIRCKCVNKPWGICESSTQP